MLYAQPNKIVEYIHTDRIETIDCVLYTVSKVMMKNYNIKKNDNK